jgi:serine/threonine protein kinase
VVHRDLKPSNVLLAEDGPRVIDFGISHAAEETSLTRTGLVMGSAGFMSPEQAEGGDVGPPSDMFSLGAVLVFAATGEGPFGTGSAAAAVITCAWSASGRLGRSSLRCSRELENPSLRVLDVAKQDHASSEAGELDAVAGVLTW